MFKNLISLLFIAFVSGFDEICLDNPEAVWPHNTDCGMYIYCDDDFFVTDGFCPEETPIFDTEFLMCCEKFSLNMR
jgi:hypothetical protein